MNAPVIPLRPRASGTQNDPRRIGPAQLLQMEQRYCSDALTPVPFDDMTGQRTRTSEATSPPSRASAYPPVVVRLRSEVPALASTTHSQPRETNAISGTAHFPLTNQFRTESPADG